MKRTTLLLVFILISIFSVFGVDRELFREAEGRFRNQNYAAALDLYERFIAEERISPDIPDAWFKSAICYYQLERYDEALKAFTKIREIYPSTKYIEFVPFWQGKIFFDRKDYEGAVVFFVEYIRDAKTAIVSEAYLYRAMCYQELGKIEDSVFSLELLLDLDNYNDDGRTIAMLCSAYLKLEENKKVIELINTVDYTKINPEYVDKMKLYKAEAYYRLNDFESALGIYFDIANEGGAVSGPAWQRLFTIYHKEEKLEELTFLLADAEKSLRTNRKILADFRMRIGVAAYNAGEYKFAEKYLLSVWDTSSPEEMSPIAPLYYSKVLERNGQIKRAIDILEIFYSNSDEMKADILIRLAELYIKNEQYTQADERLIIFFESFADSEIAYEAAYLKSFICYKRGDYEDALNYSDIAYTDDKGGIRNASLLRLEAAIYKKTENYSKAADKLLRYLDYQPNDIVSRLELIKMKFMLKEYDAIITDSADFKRTCSLKESDKKTFLITSYLAGLSAIVLSEYQFAADELSFLTLDDTEKAGLSGIYPYALFYKAWAFYRMGNFKVASLLFDELLVKYPGSYPASEAAYLAGWCEYIRGNYDRASSYFVKYSSIAGNEELGKFMYAKSLVELGRYSEAAGIFADIPRNNPDSALADDALFEKAALKATLGDVEQAASDYEYLFERLGGKLAEEGMFRRAELYYSSADYKAAVSAYYDFRINFPKSKLFDAALYWGGMAQLENGESFGAALLWERLIEDYKKSVFRPKAMLKTASVYKDAADYQEALKLYEKCRLEYSGSDTALTAAAEAEKIRYLISGLSEKEANLNVTIKNGGGVTTKEGRRAMVELAALYISMGGKDLKPALSMLNQVLDYRDKDPEAAAEAQYYLGENYYRLNKFPEAVKAFVEAAGIYPDNKDSAARALYRAADTAILAGSKKDAENIVKRLKEFYPGSAWAIEADKLIKEAK